MNKAERLAELAVILALSAKPHKQTLHKGHHIGRNALDDARKILRASDKLQRCNELACNGVERWDAKLGRPMAQWTEGDEARNEKAVEKAREDVKAVVADYRTENRIENCNIVFGTDPRGCAVKIAFTADTWAS